MTCRFIPLVLVASLCAFAAPASAQDRITLGTWGTGALIKDELGLFGAPGEQRVDNLAFTLSITLDSTELHGDVQPGYAWFRNRDGLPAGAVGEATVDGQTWRWSVADASADAFFTRAGNALTMSSWGSDRASGHAVSVHEVLDPDAASGQAIRSDDYREPVVFEGVSNERDEMGSWFSSAYLWVTGNVACADCPGGVREGLTWFVADEPYNGRWTVSPVPEPSGWMMLAGGMALLAARRKLLGNARSMFPE